MHKTGSGSFLMFAFLGSLYAASVDAVSLTLTGADVLANPQVQFPAISPTLTGTSLVFAAPSSGDFAFVKLAVVPLSQFGIAFTGTPKTVSFTVNLTVLNPSDWDVYMTLGDGTSLLGAAAADNVNGSGTAHIMEDLGDRGSDPNATLVTLFTNAGFPAVGSAFDTSFTFVLEATQTRMDMSYLAGSGSHIFARPLTVGSDLSFVLLRDNDDHEAYQLNSITFEVPIPEPSTLAFLLCGVLTAIVWTHRRKVPSAM